MRFIGERPGRPGRPSKVQATFAGCIGKRLDATMIDEGAAVEDHVLDAGSGGALGDELADGSSSSRISTGLQGRPEAGVEGRSRSKRLARDVVDERCTLRRGRPLATFLS
jgi:hypothetical protein